MKHLFDPCFFFTGHTLQQRPISRNTTIKLSILLHFIVLYLYALHAQILDCRWSIKKIASNHCLILSPWFAAKNRVPLF